MDRKNLGALGENFAAAVLESEGYRILERNFRCPCGEIDLIAERNGRIDFVEVKTRSSICFGRPADAVDQRKRQKIRRTAQWYLQGTGLDREVSFQVVEIVFNRIDRAF